MNTRDSIILRSLCSATLALAAAGGTTHAVAETTTYYSAAECDPVFIDNDTESVGYRSTIGRLYNDTSNKGLLVHCPIHHTGGQYLTGTVMALDRRSDNDVVCDLTSVNEIGTVIDRAREGSNWAHPTPLYIDFPEVEIDDTGSAFFNCFIPAGQAIQSYRVTVY